MLSGHVQIAVVPMANRVDYVSFWGDIPELLHFGGHLYLRLFSGCFYEALIVFAMRIFVNNQKRTIVVEQWKVVAYTAGDDL